MGWGFGGEGVHFGFSEKRVKEWVALVSASNLLSFCRACHLQTPLCFGAVWPAEGAVGADPRLRRPQPWLQMR